MNTAAKGRRNEHRTRDRLAAQGYGVMRAAGSKGTFDLHAYNNAHGRYVQVKTNEWPSPLEVEAMQTEPVPPGCSKEIWRWDDRARDPRVKVL